MLELTDEQKKFVLENWDKMSLLELTKTTFQNPNVKGTSAEGIAIRKFLGSKKPKTTAWEKKEVVLSDFQKEFISNNPLMRPIEVARVVFSNPRIEPLSTEVMAIKRYQDELFTTDSTGRDLPDSEYKAPTHLTHVIAKINDYAHKDLKAEGMPMAQRKMVESLRNFLRSPRFLHTINSYVSKKNRDVFEQEYVRAVWDKPDLTPDELNLYINLCASYVQAITINRQKDLLDERYEREISNPDSKVSMSLAEMIKTKVDELNKCDKRQSELVNDLNGKRSMRMKERKGGSSNIANLIAWWREESNRKEMARLAELESSEAKEELEKLSSLSEIKAQILGLSPDELLRG